MQQGSGGDRSTGFFGLVPAQGAMLGGLLALHAASGFWMWLLFRRCSRAP